MSLSCLQTRSYPSWAVNTCLTTCTIHTGPLCVGFCWQRNFADDIEGAADFLLRPPIVQTIRLSTRPDRQWGSQTRPGAWHLNSARGLAIWLAGCKRWGLSLPLPCCCWVRKDLQPSLWWNNIYSPASITLFAHLCDMTRNANWFVLQFRCCP